MARRFGRPRFHRLVLAVVFFHQHVEIGPAEPERRDVGPPEAVGLPGFRFRDHPEKVLVYARVKVHAVDGGGQGLVIKGQCGLHHAHRAGGGFRMAYLRFYRGQPYLLAAFKVGPEKFFQRAHFGGVADAGGRAVGFHQVHLAGIVVHLREGVLYGQLLALGVRGGDALALAVGGGADGIYQRVDPVAVADSVGIAFKDVDRHGLGHHEAVGPFVESPGAVGRKGAYLAELDIGGGGHHLVRAAGHGHIELAGAQAQHGVVQGGQGRGAGRVHRHVRAGHVENISYAAGRHVGQLARHGVLGYLEDVLVHAYFVFFYDVIAVGLGQAREGLALAYEILVQEFVNPQVGDFLAHGAHRVAHHHGGLLRVEGFLVVAGIFQRHPDGLYGYLLQAGDLGGGLRRYLVPDGIELEVLYEAAYLGIGLVRGFVVVGIIELPVPAVLGDLADAVLSVQYILPKLFFISGFRGGYA